MPETKKTWTINDIKAAHRAAGGHFFDPDAMRSFGSAILREVYNGPGGIYFVTRESCGQDKASYTVRQFFPPREIDSASDYRQFEDVKRAKAFARRLARTPLEKQWFEAVRRLLSDTFNVKAARLKTFVLPTQPFAEIVRRLRDDSEPVVLELANHVPDATLSLEKYSDGSGVCITQSAGRIADVYKATQTILRILWTAITGSTGPSDKLETEKQAYTPVTDAEQLADDLVRHSRGSTVDPKSTDGAEAIKRLINLSSVHHKYMVAHCNGTWPYGPGHDSEEEEPKVVRQCQGEIVALAATLGAGVRFQGDPRGATVKLVFPDGATNDFGREGWIVP